MNETVWHLFVDCDFAKRCWTEIGLWGKLDALCYEVESTEELFLRLLSTLDKEEMQRASATMWALWRDRNDRVWNETALSLNRVLELGACSVREWNEVRVPVRRVREQVCKKWHPPDAGYIKVNVDAGFFDDSLETSSGMMIRNELGAFISCRSLVFPGLMMIDEGEAWGVNEAIKWSMSLGYDRAIIETDSMRVAMVYKNAEKGETAFDDYIEEGKTLLRSRPNFIVKWSCRDANTEAHHIARIARNYASPCCWVEPPSYVDGLLNLCSSCF